MADNRSVFAADITFPGDGKYDLNVTAKDSAGNVSNPLSYTIWVDTIAPQNPTINTVTSPTSINSQDISGTKSEDTATIIVGSTGRKGAVSYPTPTTWSCTLTNLIEGTNTINVRAQDATLNESGVVSDTIILDTVKPTATISGFDSSKWYKIPVEVTFIADDASGILNLYYYLNGIQTAVPYAGPVKVTVSSEGINRIEYYAIDKAGNTAAITVENINIDKTQPSISIDLVPAFTNQNVNLTYAVSDNLTPQTEITVSGNTLYTNDGSYNVTLTATDKAGNIGAVSISFVIDRAAPTAGIKIQRSDGADSEFTNSQTVKMITLNPSEPLVKMRFSSTSSSSGFGPELDWAGAYNFTLPTGNGLNTVWAKFRDNAGNWSVIEIKDTIILDKLAPKVSITSPAQNAIVKGSVIIKAAASDANGISKVKFYKDDSLLGEDTTAPYQFSWATSRKDNGPRILKAEAIDKAGNSKFSSGVNVTVRNR